MRGIFPPVSFFFFYFYPPIQKVFISALFFFPNAIQWNSEFTGVILQQRQHTKWALHTVQASRRKIFWKNTANMTIQKTKLNNINKKKNYNNKKRKSSWLFPPPPSVVDKVHIVSRHGLVTISAHAVAQTLKTEREERGRRGEAGGFENITQAACQTCVNPSGANIDKWSGPFWS